MSQLEPSESYVEQVRQELLALDVENSRLFSRCAPITRRQALDFLTKTARELGFENRGDGYSALSKEELVAEGVFLARQLFGRTKAACVMVPELSNHALLTSDERVDILRVMWAPRLISE